MKLRTLAAKNCANYGSGNKRGICEGIMISRQLQLWVDKDYQGKKCFVAEKGGCEYFNRCVSSGIPTNT